MLCIRNSSVMVHINKTAVLDLHTKHSQLNLEIIKLICDANTSRHDILVVYSKIHRFISSQSKII